MLQAETRQGLFCGFFFSDGPARGIVRPHDDAIDLYGDRPSLLDGRPTVFLNIANRLHSPQTLEMVVETDSEGNISRHVYE